ncbi:hypothetical protein TRFO_02206 [Tritrichomonas foetus]|uniref:HRDC domain-containing protein n=1 Tax=Tritrichomonas foetus TaxID=1144522 RepID=A0A1J4JAH0_9EUKA|nr:hypothetical protein TRFO_02206 [Tritrichomonas foetus]|eukprot:OHS95231.1 hypothetical protein TRFO_02206 [Tritrichomonas foetus]
MNPKDEIDEFMNDLIDLTIIANSLPRDFDFRFKMLDDDYREKMTALSDRTLNIYSQLTSHVLTEPVEPTEDAFLDGDRAISNLLNSKDLDILDNPPQNQAKAAADVEHCQIGDFEVFYSKNIPKPPKFVISSNIPPPKPEIIPLASLPVISNPNPPKLEISKIHYISDVPAEMEFCNRLIQAFPNGPVFVACQNHRIRTYRPYCSLLLVMSPQYQVYVFDILKIRANLKPLYDLLMNPQIVKVMYDAESDLQILAESHSLYISSLLDVCTDDSLFEDLIVEPLKKCIVDWRIRPLDEKLLLIAAQSVWYLSQVAYDKLKNIDSNVFLKKEYFLPSLPYVFGQQEAEAATRAIAELDPEISDSEIKIIMELVKWRDSIAVIEEEAPNLIATDQAILKISKEKPKTAEDLQNFLGDLMTPHLSTYSLDIILTVKKESQEGEEDGGGSNVLKMLSK